MKAYQQTKSLECETSLISSKDVTEKRVAKSPKKRANCVEIVKVCLMDVYQTFYNDLGHVFISRTNRVLADHGKYIFDAKEKYS